MVVFTHTPLHIVEADAGQLHIEAEHTVFPVHAYGPPQPPQLLLSFVKSTHAPLQSVYPLLHAMPHVPVHTAVALAMPVEHAVPHVPQLLTLFVVSTHTPLHNVGVGAEHPETQVEPEQTGVPPLHRFPQVPQLVALTATQR